MFHMDDREERGMKSIIVFALILLSGCGSFTSLEQLESQALLTGDWSAVDKRERIIARRKLQAGPTCPSGMIAYCQTYMSDSRCTCVEAQVIHTLLGGR
ncbi:MAG: hypothetical protein OEU90_11160 [Gammaproteobacteria bacterium]|nr:hypothetical protein [Gammaproteobacteria bacterium]